MTEHPEEGGWAALDQPSGDSSIGVPEAGWRGPGAALDSDALPPLPPHDLIPLLPRGSTVFDALPARAVVLEPLAPAIADGVVVARRPDGIGVVLIRAGAIAEVYCVNGQGRITGSPALQRIREWQDATVSAWRLSSNVVDIIPSLLRAEPYYADLRLEWVNWERLLGDLRNRPGTFVVELITPMGRGVVNLRDGLNVASFTDTHPELCEPSLVDDIAAVNTGSLRVLREGRSAPAADDVAHSAPEDPGIAMIGAPPVEYSGAPEPSPADVTAAPVDMGGSTLDAPSPDPLETRSSLRQVLGVAPQSSAPAAVHTGPASPGTAVLLADLKLIAFNHLHRAEPQLETMLDEAAAENRPLEWVASAIRSTPLLYVSQGTLDDLADEVLALGAAQPG